MCEQVTVQLSGLTEHLGCVLCQGLLRHAQTLPECMHSCTYKILGYVCLVRSLTLVGC